MVDCSTRCSSWEGDNNIMHLLTEGTLGGTVRRQGWLLFFLEEAASSSKGIIEKTEW